MRVVMIISGLAVGGAEQSLFNIVRGLDPRFRPYVLSLSDEGIIGPRISELGIPVEALGMTSALSVLPSAIRLVRRLRELKPDVVHTWMYHSDFIGGLAAKLTGVPGIAWAIHSANLQRGKLKERTRLLVKVCAVFSHFVPRKIISVSQEATRVHIALGYDAKKIVVIPNGIDTTFFNRDPSAHSSVRAELGIPADAPLVGLIGRFDIQKNQIGFLEAASIVHREVPRAHFILVGNGVDPANAILAKAVALAGIENVTHLLGHRDDVPRLMSALDVVASSSIGEAFPLVLGEAMACEVPCAVTNVGDSAYIVGDTGQVVATEDMPALAAAIVSLLSMPADDRAALGRRARSRVQQNFELAAVIRQYEQAYDELSRR